MTFLSRIMTTTIFSTATLITASGSYAKEVTFKINCNENHGEFFLSADGGKDISKGETKPLFIYNGQEIADSKFYRVCSLGDNKAIKISYDANSPTVIGRGKNYQAPPQASDYYKISNYTAEIRYFDNRQAVMTILDFFKTKKIQELTANKDNLKLCSLRQSQNDCTIFRTKEMLNNPVLLGKSIDVTN